jgi:nucleotide-binding universal stress UspA family protein
MLRNLLIGVDGSENSVSALELGIGWARQFDLLLFGLGIIDEPAIRAATMTPIGAGYYKDVGDDARVAHARQQVGQFLDRFTRRCIVQAPRGRRRSARSDRTGSTAQTTLREFFLGSVTRNVLRKAETPLFLYH